MTETTRKDTRPTMDTATATLTETTREPLQVADRCDRCPAQAFVRVTLTTGSELHMCGHHYNQHETALAATGAEVDDYRHLINTRPSESSA